MMGNPERYSTSEREVVRLTEGVHTKVCIIDFDMNLEEALLATERITRDHPEIHVFALSSQSGAEHIIAAMRAGCTEYLFKPLLAERVVEAISRVQAKQKEKTRTKARGKVITMIGAKGGTGVTSLALHLALELVQQGSGKVLLIDQHPALGDISLYLGTGRHQYSFYELANNTERLDEDLLRGFLLQHESGLHLLDAPETLEASHYAPPSAVEDTLSFLSETYAYVVIDCPPGLTETTWSCISQSDQVAIVMTAELPSVRNTVRYLEHLMKRGYDSNSIQIVLNRHSKRGPLPDERVEKTLQKKIGLRVPNNYAEVVRAINAGTPISSEQKSDFSTAIRSWAHSLRPGQKAAEAAASKNGASSMFGIFSRG
jgi:pilus assembly protein CpaE